MRYELVAIAYDGLDQVFTNVAVRESPEDRSERPQTVLQVSGKFPGRGESEPREWAKSALIAMLEDL